MMELRQPWQCHRLPQGWCLLVLLVLLVHRSVALERLPSTAERRKSSRTFADGSDTLENAKKRKESLQKEQNRVRRRQLSKKEGG